MKIRSITAFYDPGNTKSEYSLEALANITKGCRARCQQAGYEVQTIRLATIPFTSLCPESKRDELIEFAKRMERESSLHGFDYLSLGPVPADNQGIASLIPDLISETSSTFFSALLTNQNQEISVRAIQDSASIIVRNATVEKDGFANLRFSALANVKPYCPFFPASYHMEGQPPAIAVAIQGADEVFLAFEAASNLKDATDTLLRNLEKHASKLGLIFSDALAGSRVIFQGFDFSVAPYPDEKNSLGMALERLGLPALGYHGSLAACAILTSTLDKGTWQRCGFNGLMLPLLEDSGLSHRSVEEILSMKDLLSYAAVCGTGLDTIPLPGDTSADQIEAILLDIAALSTRLNKPLTARLLPIPGKKTRDLTDFQFEYFSQAKILAVEAKPLTRFLKNGQTQIEIQPTRRF